MKSARGVARAAMVAAVAVLGFQSSAALAAIYNVQQNQGLYGSLNQNNILPNGGQYMCGPTAATNSFVFLENSYPAVYDRHLVPDNNLPNGNYDAAELIATANGLAADMGTQQNLQGAGGGAGTWDDMFIYGKTQFIEAAVPNQTAYLARLESTWGWQDALNPRVTPPIGKPDWVQQNTIPTWQFLYNQVNAGADVEVLITDGNWGHFLTVTGFSWNDANGNNTVDAAENAQLFYIDPASGLGSWSPIFQQALGGQLFVSYPSFNNAQLVMAVSENTPEPATLALLAAGAAALVARRRRSTGSRRPE